MSINCDSRRPRLLFGNVGLVVAALALPPASSATAEESTHPVADGANCQWHPALEISLFAKEPDVVDPVALTFDADGRIYVVEMRDYPYGFGPERKPGGTVRLLEDKDGEGRADHSTLFADNLSFPTSICPWNGGVLVSAPPEIIFLKDTDGDGKADTREVVFKGFTLGVTDSNVNGLRWGLDNRVHGLNGGNGGTVTSPRKPGLTVALEKLDFSFDPQTADFATTFHTSAGFGLAFDDWGRSFVTYNIDHLQQRIVPERYLRRFPGFPPVEATQSISDHGEMARIFPISVAATRPNHPEQSGHFSAAGGMGYIGWSGFGQNLSGCVLVCDVVGNLVHRDLLEEDGPIFRASRSAEEQSREFFASRDPSFRPTGVELGPDGALYLIDMQRDVIEHPDYIPEKIRAKLNLRAGEDRGRIYRLSAKGAPPPVKVKPNLSRATTAALVEALANPNQWWRMTAQRLLLERHDARSVGPLKRMAESSREPLGRLHALWTLRGLRALDEGLIERALSDPHPGLRENALLLAEPFLPGSKRLSDRILTLAGDPSPRVRFQTALTLGQIRRPDVRAALQSILLNDYPYRWTRVAALSSLGTGAGDMFVALLGSGDFRQEITPPKTDLVRELADLAAAREETKGISAVLNALNDTRLDERLKLAALEGLQSGIARVGTPIKLRGSAAATLETLSASTSPSLLAAAWGISRALERPETESQRQALVAAARRALDPAREVEKRVEDIGLLALGDYRMLERDLFALLEGTQPAPVQDAAIAVLRRFNDPAVAKRLVERWRSLAPAVRAPVINLLLQRLPFHPYLVEAIETGRITLGELNLDLEQRRRLLWKSTPDIKARAAKLMSDEEYGNRKAIVEEWLQKLPASGDPQRGKAIFQKSCAPCHKVGDAGHQVGPDLTAVAHRSVEDLASNILDPNMAINPNYVAYHCETDSGELETGIRQSESAEAIVLVQASGKTVVIPRRKIVRLESSGLSLMPEGLEAGMTPGDLRDLIAFLQAQ